MRNKMIDIEARNKFAELLHQFIAGRIENFDFEDRVPSSNDPALSEIWWQAGWPLYDDFKTHKLNGEWRIPNQYRRELAKAILFLKTNKEYIWPPKTGLYPTLISVINIVTFGLYKKYNKNINMPKLENEAWPFATLEELSEANDNPVYLNAKNA